MAINLVTTKKLLSRVVALVLIELASPTSIKIPTDSNLCASWPSSPVTPAAE